MKYLRGVIGITRLDRIRNDRVREELDEEPIINVIKRQQLKWFGHLVRMDEGRSPKEVWQARSEHKRKRGRPKKSWDNVITDNLKEKGSLQLKFNFTSVYFLQLVLHVNLFSLATSRCFNSTGVAA
ncbi:hypothetical protein RN001_013664 [Aquatica leii]|uniref:Endonuclease-reverse transcriptase n=1 Tax=Aquatica leii TaxID=1421715 RepID=A0AAN7SE16_9COLE|nr:hypothetical protein RN001_013664 [Aquatica leii]